MPSQLASTKSSTDLLATTGIKYGTTSEKTKHLIKLIQLLSSLTGGSAALLLSHLSNFSAITRSFVWVGTTLSTDRSHGLNKHLCVSRASDMSHHMNTCYTWWIIYHQARNDYKTTYIYSRPWDEQSQATTVSTIWMQRHVNDPVINCSISSTFELEIP